MAKKKRSAKGQFVATRATRVKRKRRNPDGPASTGAVAAFLEPKTNPPPMTDLVEFIIPGFGGYAATKLLHRVVNIQLSKKYPRSGKHVAAASTIGSFLAAWFLLHRIEKLAKYHTPAVVGAAIASLQTLIQTYLPKYGWIVSDVQPEFSPFTGAPSARMSQNVPVERLYPGGPEIVDDDDEGSSVEDDLADLGRLDLGVLGAAGADSGEDYMTDVN
jgi:hypothetical protein